MLTRCPSCQASVLDDDAAECPFCGSPMDPAKAKGFQAAQKPAEKPKATPAGSPSPSRSAKQRTSQKQAPAAGGKTKPSSRRGETRRSRKSGDPFAVDPKSLAAATTLARRPSEERPQKIVCPMCDTVGYAPVAASGKDVRCGNPKCMVPVFTAPDFAAPKRELEEESTSKGTLLVLASVAVVVLGGGFAYWWSNFRPREDDSTNTNVAGPVSPAPDNGLTDQQPSDQQAPPDKQEPAAPAAAPEEIRGLALAKWPRLIDTIVEIGRLPLRLSYASESYAIAGQFEQAETTLEKINPEENAFYRIGPLSAIAWAKSKAGQVPTAARIEELASLREAIPGRGFDPARTAVCWAAAISAHAGDDAAGRALITGRPDDPPSERLVADLEAAATLTGHDLGAYYESRPVLHRQRPSLAAVTFQIARHGRIDVAGRFASGTAEPLGKAECLGAWAAAEMVSGNGKSAAIREALAGADPAVRLYALCRAGVIAASNEDTASATELFGEAQTAAGQIAASKPLTAATAGELHEIDLAETAIERLRAAAFAEVAHLASRLQDQESAQTYLWRAVDHLRAAAPPVADVRARIDAFRSDGLRGIREALKTELELSDAQAQDSATDYRSNLSRYQDAASTSLMGQAEIVARGISWGLGSAILTAAQSRAAEGEPPAWMSGPAGGRLWAAFEIAGNAEGRAALEQAGVTPGDIPPAWRMEMAVWPLVDGDKPAEAGSSLAAAGRGQIPSEVRLALGLRVVGRLSREGNLQAATEFLQPVGRQGHIGELYRGWGAVAGASHQGQAYLKQIEAANVSVTTLAAGLRGLVAGLENAPPVEPDPPKSDAPEPEPRG